MRDGDFELRGGPQDGAKVRQVGGDIPATIYVGPKWLGDGYAAWGCERCDRFPCRYVMESGVFHFKGAQP